MGNTLQKVYARIAFISYLACFILGAAHLLSMADMDMGGAGCPFIQIQETLTLCNSQSSLSEKNVIIATLLGMSVVFTLILQTQVVPVILASQSLYYAHRGRHPHINSPYQDLFSQGILNTKVY